MYVDRQTANRLWSVWCQILTNQDIQWWSDAACTCRFTWTWIWKLRAITENIYSSNLTPERTDLRKNTTFWGTTFYFPRSTGQLSAERSEARQSWRSRKRKSWPKENFVPTRFQFPFWVTLGDVFSHSAGVCSTKRSKISHLVQTYIKNPKKLTYLKYDLGQRLYITLNTNSQSFQEFPWK